MSQRFIRCPFCSLPHGEEEASCPMTGKAMPRKRAHSSAPPAPGSPGAAHAVSPPPPTASGTFPPPPSSRPPASRPPPPVTTPPPPPGAFAATRPHTPPRAVDRRRLVGTVINGVYAVKALLGQGGMATVYEAEQTNMGRPVAIKVLPVDRTSSSEAQKRFLQEARAAAALSHPNICQVFDFGALPDGSPYFAMERLVGEALSDRFEREHALPFVDFIDILMQVLAGLGAAHKKGIIHRDVKPENVFLMAREGRPPFVKLLDFGVSKSVAPHTEGSGDDTTQLTRTGIVMGTPFYMAPEQAFGDRHFDARVDLWSTGVIFYEGVAGRRPFGGTSYQTLLNAIIQERPRPIRELRPGTPPEVEMVIEKALSKQREARYQSALEFMGDLQKLRERIVRLGYLPSAGSASRQPVAPGAPGAGGEGQS